MQPYLCELAADSRQSQHRDQRHTTTSQTAKSRFEFQFVISCFILDHSYLVMSCFTLAGLVFCCVGHLLHLYLVNLPFLMYLRLYFILFIHQLATSAVTFLPLFPPIHFVFPCAFLYLYLVDLACIWILDNLQQSNCMNWPPLAQQTFGKRNL